jgi:predicted ribosome quality control (RQC) complex YloA/Tae2 family protein
VPDPYEPGSLIAVPLDPRLSLRANADRLFEKARRVDRGRKRVEARLAETRTALDLAKERERRAERARDLKDLDPLPPEGRNAPDDGGSGPRHYLSSRGLSILVGRGARENHHLTFAIARPEDLWFHARDVPGAHVILRDNEGRAGPEDQREAAEVAAFFSEARGDAGIDVHVTRRKHVRAAGGGPGRVKVGYSETLRVTPRDPEGRLRRR